MANTAALLYLVVWTAGIEPSDLKADPRQAVKHFSSNEPIVKLHYKHVNQFPCRQSVAVQFWPQ